ncbi:Peptidase M19, renal dipeptidase [Penicillium expansum]|uniref:Dipeptidase n=1 Tax=Penicillium expansum TaxID=27334 RepID=A0A0A2K4J6_PENEN|nr:Peptidase M19, renal dipeptidase [Penicillium expansum]KGO61823.1 Peptidase M19, renal dipeptidase [Penicillium expansum]KGO62215.1 Peptidase M19, renal dipeptidase [Penicillium expansum]
MTIGSSFMEQALEILGSVPLVDGHNDWPHLIRGFYDSTLDGRFQRGSNLVGHVDLKRLKEGKSGGAFWSVYIDCPNSDDFTDDAIHFEALRDTIQQIDLVHRIVDLYSDDMGLVEDSSDIMRLFKAGRFASLIGVEGLHQIANSASVLRMYYKLGVRYVTLAHNKNNTYADSATSSSPAHGGLSAQGIQMVREMNRIGMIIDLSHTSEAAMHQVLGISKAPVMFSHSAIASIVPHVRNVSNAVLKKLKVNNGVIMITFIPSLIHAEASEANIDHIVDNIIYAGDLIGYNHVGLGSDYDGMFSAVKGVDDVSFYPDLVAKMLERDIPRSDVEKVIGLNIIRVLGEVEAQAAKMKSQSAVMEDGVKQLWNNNFRATVESVYPDAEKSSRNK